MIINLITTWVAGEPDDGHKYFRGVASLPDPNTEGNHILHQHSSHGISVTGKTKKTIMHVRGILERNRRYLLVASRTQKYGLFFWEREYINLSSQK